MQEMIIRLFPEDGPPYSRTLEVDTQELESFDSPIEYVQEVHAPQHNWEFTF